MDPARWQQIERLYHQAQARPAGERAAFLREACAGDEALRQGVEALLDAPVVADGSLLSQAGPLRGTRRTVASVGGETDVGPVPDAGRVLSGEPDVGRISRSGSATPLTGSRLGVYQIQDRIGAGGMGEVYRARDTRLGRDVAIKILPPAFIVDPDRLARFEREARVLAALNHPNIATIHGLEESAGVRGLVMELVDGETLAARIERGPLRVGEALAIATQIVAALEAAHDKGIVHRDLKPPNIKLTPAGTVKVLDFGLAKAVMGETMDSQAPTVTVGGTREGMILGTPAYMSPEQARGRPVDKRTDIWAFGCVLYEMLTGRAAFAENTLSDTLAALLSRAPDWSALPSTVPSGVRRVLARCLEKDRGGACAISAMPVWISRSRCQDPPPTHPPPRDPLATDLAA